MRIPTGVTDQYIYFVAVDSTDLKTRETGLSSFTVYRSRNGGAAAAFTTPTINETDSTNMPGVYELLLDEDMDLDAGDDSQEVCLHITQASMAPVTRVYELYRPKITAGQTVTAANGCADADIERLQGNAIATPTVNGVLEVDVTHWIGTAAATPTVAGVPEVDVTHVAGATTDVSALATNVAAILADTGTDGVVVAAASKTGYALSSAGVDAIIDDVIEGSTTMRELLRLFAAALIGKLAGAATTTVTMRDLADLKDRITATVDADGNRTAITLDAT